jgi:ESCO1/2 acetyl-transferase/zinc-finger of acetyl-transferase ESCO
MSSQDSSDSGYDESLYSDDYSLGSEPRRAAKPEGKDEHGSNNSSRSGSRSNVSGPSTQNLHQTQLDMGVPAIKHCKDCGMDYNTTLASDRRHHDKYHRGIVEAKQPNNVPAGVNLMETYDGTERQLIRVIDYRAPAVLKTAAQKALDATDPVLGGWDEQYNHRDLWALITNPRDETDPNEVPRYKLYLYLVNLDVVGVLLVERIAVGRLYYSGPVIYNENGKIPEEVVKDCSPGETQQFIFNDEKYKCHMGIDRIWVHPNMRRKRIASQLLDSARQSFVPGITIRRDEISFSQPTLLGRELASKYCAGVFKDGLFLTDIRQPFNRVQDGMLHSY